MAAEVPNLCASEQIVSMALASFDPSQGSWCWLRIQPALPEGYGSAGPDSLHLRSEEIVAIILAACIFGTASDQQPDIDSYHHSDNLGAMHG